MTTPNVEINLKDVLVLQRNGIITSAGDGYGITYFLSEEILEKFWKKKKGRRNCFYVEWSND